MPGLDAAPADSAADLAPPPEAPPASPTTSGEVDIAAKSAEIAAMADNEAKPPVEPKDDEAKPAEDEAKPEDEEPKVEEPPEVAELKAELAQRDERVASLEKRDSEWRDSALEALVQNRALADKVALLEQYLQEHDIGVDERDLQILELKAAGYTGAIKDAAAKHGTARQQEAAVTTRATEMRLEATSVAQKSGLPLDALVTRWNAMSDRAGKTVSFEEASKSLLTDISRVNSQPQLAANAKINKVLPKASGASSSKPSFAPPTSDEGIRQRLEAQGIKLD